ncbi:tRNA lysidine(34) synthetase TilS [Candidatus Protochlamydia phocaeensis]|uniref:tRNA lysidine(34) synthetase TilS n=1 Tax=Candidatus Protochlamydia phocaeensis TaxID=1414722 RepID=UPI000837F197|nr:tRNA lysidine(34) synthetase TilS [Candidatus Protochlamydia phocaeensis]
MPIVETVSAFLNRYCSVEEPLLLAFSGGPDSLCLFYSLLACQKIRPFVFHVAHVDHGWRPGSGREAEYLRQLASQHGIPFHLTTLQPDSMQGNLEAACRDARYRFFNALCQKYGFQAVMLGHQSDDQAETVLKRIFEGSYWRNLSGLKEETRRQGMRLLRPLLPFSKTEIYAFLNAYPFKGFEDPTNQDERFLRARMRQSMIPWLNEMFGKNVQNALIDLAHDMQDMNAYFDQRLTPLLSQVRRGPWGIYVDLSQMPMTSVEVKYLVRRLCEQEGFFLSRPQIEAAAQAFLIGKANQCFEMGKRRMWIDRKCLFLISSLDEVWKESCLIEPGMAYSKGKWQIESFLTKDHSVTHASSWKEALQGKIEIKLPVGNYVLQRSSSSSQAAYQGQISLNKWWGQHKVPAFLRQAFPVIWQGACVFREFLSGKSVCPALPDQTYLTLRLTYQSRQNDDHF